MRVYPHHNDVRVWRVWEVGACLSENLIQHPNTVWGRSVMEVGSRVGLPGLVVAGLCRPSRVSLTNFTDACLTNLAHNVELVNRYWMEGQGVVTRKRGDADDGESSPGPLSMPPFLKYYAPCLSVSLPPCALPQKSLSCNPS